MNTLPKPTLVVDLRRVHVRNIDGRLVSLYDAFFVDGPAAQRVAAIWPYHEEGMWLFHLREAVDWVWLEPDEFHALLEEARPWPNVVTCP